MKLQEASRLPSFLMSAFYYSFHMIPLHFVRAGGIRKYNRREGIPACPFCRSEIIIIEISKIKTRYLEEQWLCTLTDTSIVHYNCSEICRYHYRHAQYNTCFVIIMKIVPYMKLITSKHLLQLRVSCK